MVGLESGVLCHAAVHSLLKSSQYWSKLCFRVQLRLQKDRLIWGWGRPSSLEDPVDGVGVKGAYLQETLELSG